MTQTPAAPTNEPLETRPTSLTVFAVLNIVFGAMGTCFSPFNLVQVLVDPGGNPIYEHMQAQSWFVVYSIIAAIFGMLLGLAMLAAGIGLLRDRPWGRSLSIFSAVAQLVMLVIAVPALIIVMMPLLNSSDNAEVAGAIAGMVGGGCAMIFGAIYPILLLFFMNRQVAKDWMAQQAS